MRGAGCGVCADELLARDQNNDKIDWTQRKPSVRIVLAKHQPGRTRYGVRGGSLDIPWASS